MNTVNRGKFKLAMKTGRREFITKLTAAGAALPLGFSPWNIGSFSKKIDKPAIAMFTKPLDDYELDFMAATMAMAGIDSFDLAVRPGGRVNPENVADELPRVIETGKKYGLTTELIVTSIREANTEAELILKTAAHCGVKHYRLGYFSYDFKKGIWDSLQDTKRKLRPLVQLNEEAGIQAGYQNHSGTRLGAPVWDVWELIRDYPVEHISSQFDIRHAVTEGAASWILALRLMSKSIGSLAVKDFTWEVIDGKARVVSVPLGQGIVDFDQFFSLLHELGITAPISLHVEYPLLEGDEENLPLLQKQKIIATKLKKDVDFIRRYLNKI
jgi:L-ribulose-5-phosphate 3-epimerase